MPLLLSQQVDRQLLYLNEGAYAVYIDAADRKGSDPWVRWARNHNRCLPLTLWQHLGKPLAPETVERDLATINTELRDIAQVIGQGRTLIFPMGEYTTALEHTQQTSPRVADRVETYLSSWRNM